MFSLICARINDRVNNREAGDLRRYRGQYDVIVMRFLDNQGTQLFKGQTYIHVGMYAAYKDEGDDDDDDDDDGDAGDDDDDDDDDDDYYNDDGDVAAAAADDDDDDGDDECWWFIQIESIISIVKYLYIIKIYNASSRNMIIISCHNFTHAIMA